MTDRLGLTAYKFQIHPILGPLLPPFRWSQSSGKLPMEASQKMRGVRFGDGLLPTIVGPHDRCDRVNLDLLSSTSKDLGVLESNERTKSEGSGTIVQRNVDRFGSKGHPGIREPVDGPGVLPRDERPLGPTSVGLPQDCGDGPMQPSCVPEFNRPCGEGVERHQRGPSRKIRAKRRRTRQPRFLFPTRPVLSAPSSVAFPVRKQAVNAGHQGASLHRRCQTLSDQSVRI